MQQLNQLELREQNIKIKPLSFQVEMPIISI